jgi:hypothetical protein
VTPRSLATLVAAVSACASRPDAPDDTPHDTPHDARDAAVDAGRTTAVSSPAEADAGSPWESMPPVPPPPRCALQPSGAACRPGGFLCDVVHAVPCCGSCIDGMCCSAREQPCSDALVDTCCAGLRCGSRCVCE